MKKWLLGSLVLLMMGLVLYPTPVVHGCEIAIFTNWWYIEAYTLDESALPDSITYTTTHSADQYVTEDRLYLNVPGATPLLVIRHGVTLTGTHGQPLAEPLTEISFDLLTQNDADRFNHRNWLSAAVLAQNPEAPGGVPEILPPPLLTSIDMVYEDILYRVPLTITYQFNPYYDPARVIPHPMSLAEQVAAAAYIFEATLIEGEREWADLDRTALGGPIQVEVHQWLKGDGPAEFAMHGLSGTTCDPTVYKGQRLIILANKSGDDLFRWQNFPYETGLIGANPTNRAAIIALTGQGEAYPGPDTSGTTNIPPTPELTDTTPEPTDTTPVPISTPLLWGGTLLAVIVVIALSWRKRMTTKRPD